MVPHLCLTVQCKATTGRFWPSTLKTGVPTMGTLRWPVPYNLISALEENLSMLECKLGIDIHTCLQDIITIHSPCGGNHTHPEQCTHFYPLQTCSNICGIIVMCMVNVMTESWEDWYKWTNLTAPEVLRNPSLHGTYLRINVLSWIVEDKIDVTTLNKVPSSSKSTLDKQDIITIHSPCGGNHTHPEQCTHFYPLQTCSIICGIIVMCMVNVMTESWEDWYKWTNLTAPEVLRNPSLHDTYLRINVLSWIVEDKIDVTTLNKVPSSSKSTLDKVESMPATLKYTLVHANTTTTNQTSTGDTCSENSKPKSSAKTKDISSDEFFQAKKAIKKVTDLSSSEDEIYTQNKTQPHRIISLYF